MNDAKVPLGQVVVTPAAQLAVEQAHQRIDEFLDRHQAGDWGNTDEQTRQLNEEALRSHGPILSVHETCAKETLWVVSENGITTVFLPM
jgi:hypothetical protein